MTMMAATTAALFLCSFLVTNSHNNAGVEASTRVSVLEFGNRGAVRRTTATNEETTVEGVASFWSRLHPAEKSARSKPQHSGMTVVPDLFQQADQGVVIALYGEGVDLDEMPTVSKLVAEEEEKPVVGHMQVQGKRCHDVMSRVQDVEEVESKSIAETSRRLCGNKSKKFSGMKASVDKEDSDSVDQQIAQIVEDLGRSGESVVLHLVVEENSSVPGRRLSSISAPYRRLEDQADAGGDQVNNNNGGYYGYGYYDEDGNWVTPYKTMFQIQYFNIVVWTAIGLFVTLFFTIYLMMYMPLEADTLLFGESAKMVGEE